jgi:muramoyltetrapeptide carboxypeptidase
MSKMTAGLIALPMLLFAASAAAEERLPMIWPPLLKPGDTIMFVAPAGPPERDQCERARQRIEELGYKVQWRDDMFDVEGYLAGSDERRADELMEAFTDPAVDAVFCTRGGYGCMRMIDRLDYDVIRSHPKIVIGFSDITALHAALNRRAGLITFHGPGPASGMGGDEPPKEFTSKNLHLTLLADETPAGGYTIDVPSNLGEVAHFGHGKARGRLVGGNLSLVSAIEGTPYALDCEDAILVIEDVREAPYRIDRMLRQLQLAGKLEQLRGVVLGQFTQDYSREDQLTADDRFSTPGVLRQYFENAGIPVLVNFPLGHVDENCTLPLGAEAEIDADAGTLRIIR